MQKQITGLFSFLVFFLLMPPIVLSQSEPALANPGGSGLGLILLIIVLIAATLGGAVFLAIRTSSLRQMIRKGKKNEPDVHKIVRNWSQEQIDAYVKHMKMKNHSPERKQDGQGPALKVVLISLITSLFSSTIFAQGADPQRSVFSEGGIIITLVLIFIPLLAVITLMIIKVGRMSSKLKTKRNMEEAARMSAYLNSLPEEEITEALRKRKEVLGYQLSENLSGNLPAEDKRGLLKNINEQANLRFIEEKRRAIARPNVEPKLSRLVVWYLVTATVWLIFGTTVGEYLGIKFVAPDADNVSWLSFGRLRPVHTNSVFWGWSSLGMIGLGYYVIPRVGNNKVYSLKWGWWTLWLLNIYVLLGSITVMLGINNGGGEFREYIWPIEVFFAAGVVITLVNYIKTIARRKTREIYVSNWYIVAACIFGVVIKLVGYLPFWQTGLGETITQGYYMHQAVGMWFMMFTLGLIYYFLPQQLNRPIYSYSLGILAFWSQIFFYTVIGTHHFIFSSIPWSLQTVAIVGSVGMIIPVVAGTTNFIMTFKGSWHKLAGSYTLPFFLIGIIFYFTGSMQGTAEAFRTTNLYWHFTDFTVAHSHLTMYGIIAFFLWGFIYAIIPRITRQEPPQITVGIHFWLAFLGLLFYSVPLMIGGTLKGIMWMDGKPFIDSVIMMAPYWLWRAIGGTLMWISHLVFAYNMYKMIRPRPTLNINEDTLNLAQAGSDAELVHIQ